MGQRGELGASRSLLMVRLVALDATRKTQQPLWEGVLMLLRRTQRSCDGLRLSIISEWLFQGEKNIHNNKE